MWILQCKANPDVKHYILVGKDYVVGRKDVDIVVPDDMSVSRNHCTLSVTHSERHLMNPSQVPVLNIQEKSKFGTILQGVQIRGQQKTLNDGDIIKFGTQQSEYQVIYEPWIITTSCLENTRKRALRTKVLQLGGHMVNEWQRGCSLLVMSNISVTIKVICALVCKRPIVTPHYIDDYIEAIQQKKPVPDHTGYIPDLVESQLDPSNVSFKPMAARSDIFQGKIFVFLAEKQFKKMQLALEMGGAMTLLMDEAGDDEMITQRETCVMQCQRQDTKSPEWYDTVVSLLEKNKRRMIPDAEIGYAVLHCCVEKYCNPEIQSDEDQPGIPSQTLSQHQEVPETVLDETSHSQSQAAHSRHAQSASKIEGDSDSSYHTVNIKQEPISPKSQRQSHDTPKKRLRQDDTEVTQPASKAIKTEPGGTSQRKGKTQTLDSFFQRKPTSKKEGTEQQSRNLDASNSGTKRSQESLPADNKPVSSRTLRSQSRSPSPVPGNLDSLKSRRKSQSPAPEVKPRGKRSRAQRSPSPVPNVSQNSVRSRSQKSPSPVPDVSQRSVRSRSQKSPSPVPGENQSSGRSRSQRSPSPVPESPPMPVRKRARRTPSPAPPKVKIEPGCEEESDVKPGPSTSTTTHRPSIKQELPDPDEGSAAHGRPAPLPLTNGFLCTNRPAPCKRDPDLDQEELEGKINVESRSLMVRKPGAKYKQQITTGDDGYCTWQGKRIKNFKKFRKTSHVGADKLPYIIGGTDLVVHTAASSRDLDEFFAEQSQNISQQNEQQKLANDLFEWEPRTKKKGRR